MPFFKKISAPIREEDSIGVTARELEELREETRKRKKKKSEEDPDTDN